jgi:hypothetical protein
MKSKYGIKDKFITLMDSSYLSSSGSLAFLSLSLIIYYTFCFFLFFGFFLLLDVPWYIKILSFAVAFYITLAEFKNFLRGLFEENFISNKKSILEKIYIKLRREYTPKRDYMEVRTDEDYDEDEKEIRNLSITLHEIEKIFTEQEIENQKKLEELYLQNIDYYIKKRNEN